LAEGSRERKNIREKKSVESSGKAPPCDTIKKKLQAEKARPEVMCRQIQEKGDLSNGVAFFITRVYDLK
jgi:hypothetical protein